MPTGTRKASILRSAATTASRTDLLESDASRCHRRSTKRIAAHEIAPTPIHRSNRLIGPPPPPRPTFKLTHVIMLYHLPNDAAQISVLHQTRTTSGPGAGST